MMSSISRAVLRRLACAALSVALFASAAVAEAAGPAGSPGSAASSGAAGSQAVGPLRRFALVIGANNGGESLTRLRYAASDARSFAAVMTELGGVSSSDLVLLIDPGLASFRGAASRLESSAAAATAAGTRCELVLYYSGHSDDEGLLLGKDKLGYSELRASIEKVPASVRVAILDSCSSGSLTRAKGGSSKPAFLLDASSIQEGHAYITSSSADEAAQESDKIGGSFFTHYLVSALRGAADSHGEGKVTLNEAYAYSFRETLASTENTQYGPQHPGFEISLTGSGDLVVTDLRSSKAGLSFSEELAGEIYVRDAKGNLSVELDKAAGDRMELGLPPGKYSVAMIDGEARSQADVLVATGAKAALKSADFRRVSAAPTDARGIEVQSTSPTAVPSGEIVAGPRKIVDTSLGGFPISFGMTLLPDFSQGIYFSQEDEKVAFNILWGGAHDIRGLQASSLINADSGEVHGFQLAGVANVVKEGASGFQLAGFANVVSGDLSGGQSSGFGNFVAGDSSAAQLAGFANMVAGRARFAQVAGFGNIATGGFSGAQVSGGVNLAGGDSRGAQVAVVNIASHISGAQVGIVNISDRLDGAAVGLVNIEKGGVLSPEIWTENGAAVCLGYAFGTRLFYTLASVGFGVTADSQSPGASLGMGARLTIGRFFGDIDFSWREIFGDASRLDFSRPQARLEARALAGFPAKGPGVILGCVLEGYMPGLSRGNDGSPISAFRVAPGFLVGAKL